MSVYQNINGSLYRMDASDLVQLAAVDTEGILGGTPGATTNGQNLVDQLAADDVQAQTDIGQIKTDLPNYLTIADEQVLGAWNVLSVPSSVVTQTNNGVTFTITRNSSGQVTEVDANGTAGTGGSRFTFTSDNVIRKGRYYAKNGTGYSINYQENGVVNHSGNTDDFVVDWSQDIACRIVWDIAATVQVNHVKFYPQLALKPNMPFSPFVMTNAELTTPKSGTCTATITSNNATLQSANYVLIGRVLWAYIKVKLSSALATSGRVIITLSGLPQNNALGTSIFALCFGAPSVIAWFGSPNPNNVIIQNNGAEIATNTEIQLSGCIPV